LPGYGWLEIKSRQENGKEISKMVRKKLYLLTVVCMLSVALMPAGVALADKPEPPKFDLERPGGPPVADMASLPEAVQQAVALQEGLTAEQHAAVRAILDKHLPEVEATTKALMAELGVTVDASVGKLPSAPDVATNGEPAPNAEPVDREIMARIEAMVNSIDAEMAAVLDADQLALYRAVVRPELARPDTVEAEAAAGPEGSYTSNCYYGAYYDARAEAYAWLGYLYAYYDYYYNGYTYAYYAYYYAYQTYVYSRYALGYSAPVYFTYYFFNQYTSGYPYNAYYYSSYAETYGYYAYYYGYYNYYYNGTTYGYYAYVYNYNAYSAADYGHYYTYYCYYYS
jgi:hypothetical protein